MTPPGDVTGGGAGPQEHAAGGSPQRRGRAERLRPDEVDAQLTRRRLAWQRRGDELVKTVQLPTFPDAIAFVDRVAELAEAADHHPDIDIRWRTVTLRLSTHSAGGLTAADVGLASEIDDIDESGQSS